MYQDDEYTDYSCSTSIERLARDVETILRGWHVDRGSDRHVSIARKKKGPKDLDDPTSNLIRSNTITWNLSLSNYAGRKTLIVDLELALWDALDGQVDNVDDEKEEEDDDPLVRSLRRRPLSNMPSHDFWFDNLSTLFGIGQHISLTPIQPEPMPTVLSDFLGNSILHRHDDRRTATYVYGSILSGWLQTALNCAISNCQCCIPAFGIWGLYRPDQLLPTHPTAIFNSGSSLTSDRQTLSDDDLVGTTIKTSQMKISTNGLPVFPKWVSAIRSSSLPAVNRKFRNSCQRQWNTSFVPPLVAGSLVSPSTVSNPSTSATFWCSVVSGATDKTIAKNSRLTVWGSVLLQHCPDSTVVLSGARHVFGWFKARKPTRTAFFSSVDEDYIISIQEWRLSQNNGNIDPKDELRIYLKDCRDVALGMLAKSWGRTSIQTPLWGPLDDPVASVYATATWNGKSNEDGIVEPLLSFPLRIRSRRVLSKQDWIDMEESVERTILDPLQPSRFSIQSFYDRETSASTLAANQRCILAALIRAATLPGETLLQHLTDVGLVELWDDNAGTIVANKLADRAHVRAATKRIVEALDWSSFIEDMISMSEAEEIVHNVMSGSLTLDFPSPPEEELFIDSLFEPFRKAAPLGRLISILFAHMARLRSVSSMALVWKVFIQELRRRWETRESLPNMQYIPGLDPSIEKLYERRCFSSIGVKAQFSAFLHCSEPDPDDYHCLIGQKLQVFNLGVELVVASELAEHEAMERFLVAGEVPISIPNNIDTQGGNTDSTPPAVVSASMFDPADPPEIEEERRKFARRASSKKWPKAKDAGAIPTPSSIGKEDNQNYGPPTIDTDLDFWVMDAPGHAAVTVDQQGFDFVSAPTDDTGFDFVGPPPAKLDDIVNDTKPNTTIRRGSTLSKRSTKIVLEGLPDSSAWEGTVMDGGSHGSVTTMSQSQQYFDAAEAGSIFSIKKGFVNFDTVINVDEIHRRPGARCPVLGASLELNGDQLYAPYLQRPPPLTDDLVLERRTMLARRTVSPSKYGSTLQSRIDLAHRLQRPKLISDMRAFKAANPGAQFGDFTSWYGNPGNPLDDYNETEDENGRSLLSYSDSTAKKLDKASEAMKILTLTRDFWARTWDEALAAPAAEQDALFDVFSCVEITLDYLEQMHPANLVNQIFAVNLSASYFTLVTSASETLKIGVVHKSMHRLRKKIDRSLHLLARDAAGGASTANDSNNHHHHKSHRGSQRSGSQRNGSSGGGGGSGDYCRFVSEEAITACEEACIALSEAETMVARAMSLLTKFPSQYVLVQDLLREADGTTVSLSDHEGRSSFLNAIQKQQKQHSNFKTFESWPIPVQREYVFRNLDEGNPCQLSVRFGDEGAYLDRVDCEGGVLLAMTKSYID